MNLASRAACVTAFLLVAGLLLPGSTAGQDSARTPWGDPDLQGIWSNTTTTPLQRPEELAGRDTLADEIHTVRYSDRRDWTTDFHLYDRCLTRALPGSMMPGFYNHNYNILQTPDYVAIQVEMIHDVRIIPLDGRPHIDPSIQQWLGSSRGCWEGDTLVVETSNLSAKANEQRVEMANVVFGIGENARIVERFTRLDADTIDYRVTVHDPTTYQSAWTASIPMTAIEGALFEYACHEGNYALRNMLSGARADEAAVVAAAQK